MSKKKQEKYDVLDVGRFIINYSNDNKIPISNLKLQKLLYFVQAWFLVKKEGVPCFNNKIEAWSFGPVVPDAYHEFKGYGGGDISRIDSYFEVDYDNKWNTEKVAYDENKINESDRKLIIEVIDKFKDKTATYLVYLTHEQDPWKNAYKGRWSYEEITHESIMKYFNEK